MTEHGVGKHRGLVRSALTGDTRLRAERCPAGPHKL
jgi:hypothetical protein